jgi:hypothetical protein
MDAKQKEQSMDEDKDTDKAEDKVTRESEDELSDEELGDVTGGESITFNYGHIQYTY